MILGGRFEKMKMNNLEIALLDRSGMHLDLYLEDTGTKQIMADIEEIRKKAALSTDAGKLKEQIMEILNR